MQKLEVKLAGLYSMPNEISEVPQGALLVADNIVIDRDSIAEPRRGFDFMTGGGLPSASDRGNQLYSYQDQLLAHYSNTTIAYKGSTAWVPLTGTFNKPDTNLKIRGLLANSNLYLAASAGVYKMDVYTANPALAGVPKGLDIQATTSATAGYLTGQKEVAYRALWGINDANSNLILGTPSNREVLTHNGATGAASNVSVTIYIPDGITTTHFYQLYRTSVPSTTGVEPNDEMGLVYENNPTTAQIAAGSITVVDSLDDSLIGANLYTSPSEEGIFQSNDEPKFCKDMTYYNNMVMCGNVKSKQRYNLTLVAVSGSSGVTAGSTITIDGITYTAATVENVTAGNYKATTTGSVAQNIADTAKSLSRTINQYPSTTGINSYYVSNYNDLPGKILLESTSFNRNSFAVTVNGRQEAWSPVLPLTGTIESSQSNNYPNGVWISKVNQPESFPYENLRFAGSRDQVMYRIIGLRTSVFCLKADGIFRAVGDSPQDISKFQAFDDTVKLLAPETAVKLNNKIYCLTDQGVVAISDSGVEVLSRPIETDLLQIMGLSLNAVAQYSFGVGYESDRRYVLWTISTADDTYATQAFAYNYFTKSWVRWTMNANAAIVHKTDDKLYIWPGNDEQIWKERKDYSLFDYSDPGLSRTVTAVSGTTLTLDSIENINIGDAAYQSQTVYSKITDINVGLLQITVKDDLSFALGAITIEQGIDCNIQWIPQIAGNPGLMKHWQTLILTFKSNNFRASEVGFGTELSSAWTDTTWVGNYGKQWGLFAWGSIPWGGGIRGRLFRTFVPKDKGRSTQLLLRYKLREAFSHFALQGYTIFFTEMGNIVMR